MENTEEWYERLRRTPEDWSVRLRLIESAVQKGDLTEAKRLVRTATDEDPLPVELQQRIHALLTQSGAGGGDAGASIDRPAAGEVEGEAGAEGGLR